MCLLPQYEQVAITDITKQLQDKGLFNKPGILQTVWVLHGLIDKNETVTVDGAKHKRGATCPIAQKTIADLIGVSRRATAHGYLKELIDAGILRAEKASFGGANCYRYIFTIFDRYAEEQNTCTVTGDSTDEGVRSNEEPVRSNGETCTAQGVHIQEVQELQEPPLNVSGNVTGLETDEVSEKRGDDINLEDKDSPKEKDFDAEAIDVIPKSDIETLDNEGHGTPPVDIVPTTEIGKAKEVDELVGSIMGEKQSNTKPPEDGIQQFIDSFNDAFNLESVAVLSQAYVEPALELQKGISSKLSAAGLALPVNRFLGKYLVPCVKASLADGTLDELPRAFGFFLRKPKGKQVLDRSIGVAKASNSVTQSVERTNKRLDDLKERKPVSAESAKKQFSEMIADAMAMPPDEAKRLRRLRE